MKGLRRTLSAAMAARYRSRANRILARVDRLLAKARRLKDQAATLETPDRDAHQPRDGP